jgi:phosphohistidine phosphatase
MKTLYLVRHAKSDWSDQSLTDFDRPLNNRGKKDAPFMGKVLREKEVAPDIIISSPAKRAKETAMEIAGTLNYPSKKIFFEEELYDASSNNILSIVKNIDEKYSFAMIFGHNPGLTLLNNRISNKYIDNIPTTGIVALSLDVKWSEVDKFSCKQLFFEYPKLYR